MKKILTALVFCLIFTIANAETIYVVGSGTVDGKSLGNPGNAVAISSNTNVYTFDVSNIDWLKMSTNNASDWANYDRSGFVIKDKDNYKLTTSELRKIFTIWYGNNDGAQVGRNINPPSSGNYTYTLIVGDWFSDQSRLFVINQGDSWPTFDIYLRNSTNGYATNSSNKMTPDASGYIYTLENVSLSSGTKFKIADDSWGILNYGLGGSVNPNQNYNLYYKGDNCTLTSDIKNATIKYNLKTGELYIDNPEEIVLNDYKVYFDNTSSQWDDVYIYTFKKEQDYTSEAAGGWPGTKLDQNSEGLYEWIYKASEEPSFDGIIFNNGKDGEGKEQTENLEYVVGKTYSYVRPVDKWYLQSNIEKTGWEAKEMTQVENSSVWFAEISPVQASGELLIRLNDNNYYRDTKRNQTLTPMNTIEMYEGDGGDAKFSDFEIGKSYTIYWEPATNTLSVATTPESIPASLYIYGHVNDGYWHTTNYIPVLPKANEPGVYYVEKAEIGGFWKADECDNEHPERKEYGSTGDENYICFVDHIFVGDDSNFGGYKYGSVVINDWIDGTEDKDLKYQGWNNYNFQVKRGFYNITVDLNQMKVIFDKYVEPDGDVKTEVEYTWYVGSGEPSILDDQDNHAFNFGDDSADVIQVGIGNNPQHRVARQSDYEVWYRTPNYVSSKNIKAYADETEVKDPSAEGYTEAIPTTFDEEGNVTKLGDYTNIGSPDYSSNHLIQLNRAGDYYIIANLHEDATNVDSYELSSNNRTLSVSVNQAKVVLATDDSGDIEAKFSNTGVELEDIIVFNTSTTDDATARAINLLTEGQDFTVTITPNTDGWESVEGYDTEASDEAKAALVEAAYQAKLPASLYQQYVAAKGSEYIVDGLYTAVENIDVTDTNADGTYSLSADFPCSGVYKMVISPVSTGNADFTEKEFILTINPNIQQMYGEVSGVSINGIGFNSGNASGISYPTATSESTGAWNPENSFVYTPGLYFPANFEIGFTDSYSAANSVAVYAETAQSNYYGQALSMENAPSTGELYYTVSKNGATTTSSISFEIFGSLDGTSTGVEGIESVEEGEAVYYNLQGVKVDNPEHGIYVKVVNGKASKVVL